ncbi:TlpA disulfide reductase family protein [Flavobacterium sp.]|uniref:TlpA family protein disulfide reductase n=1 Tax=Flavobacterium sp. TaxID=239 RepID=UPI0026203FAB|nr:TlpA disulfide reductase family protein [Flavobacterium sp.]
MKHTLYLVLIVLFASFTTPKETITLSGKITNTEDGKIKIRGEAFEKDITLKADGTFSETFQIDYQGSYSLFTKNNRISLYLGKGSKLAINADEKNFDTTLSFMGDGSVENKYISEKTKIVAAIKNEDLYKLDEADFLKKIAEMKASVTAVYNKTKFSNANFKEKELQNIKYLEQIQILNYPSYHAHYAKIQDFITSETFPKFDSKIDLDNEADFLFSNTYKQIIEAKFNQFIESKAGQDADYTAVYALPEIKKIKSVAIKNARIKTVAYEVGAGNPEATNLYNELMALSTDVKFKEELTTKFNKIKTLIAGNASPKFDYENYKGGKTSLESLKGKYVYIDVWATWCGPCRKEIPSLQKVEEQYEGKNIEFVSLSIDAKKDYEKWKKFVDEKKLGGIQLFADNDWNSQFAKDYAIEGIPRFILIDPNGNIVSADAPRPSDPKLIQKFTELGIK